MPSATKRFSALQKAGFCISFAVYFTRSLSRLVISPVVFLHPAFPVRPGFSPGNKTKGRPRAVAYGRCLQTYFAAFAVSTSFAKDAESLIAISESILRFRSIPAFFRPFIKVE